jgi:hypothetical protein
MNSRLSKNQQFESDSSGILTFLGVAAVVCTVIALAVLFLNDPQGKAFIELILK